MQLLSILALAAPLVAAIQFTSPDAGVTLDRGVDFTLTWTTVDTDPSDFSVYLWNFDHYPPTYAYLASVKTSDQSVTLKIPCDVDPKTGYQFNAIAGSNVYQIYAQSPRFTVDNNSCTGPTLGPGGGLCPGGATATVTVTATATQTVHVSRSTSSTTKNTSSTLSSTSTKSTGTGTGTTSTYTGSTTSTKTTESPKGTGSTTSSSSRDLNTSKTTTEKSPGPTTSTSLITTKSTKPKPSTTTNTYTATTTTTTGGGYPHPDLPKNCRPVHKEL